MNISDFNSSLFTFLETSTTPFHACSNIADFFKDRGFQQLKENESWSLQQGSSYYVIREGGAIIAFTLGFDESSDQGFRIIAAHTDSPCLQVKPQPDVKQSSYHQLGVEVYGGSLLSPWFDRDLSIAGRICCRTKGDELITLLIDFKRSLVMIPSVAIHLNREANKGYEINKQTHLPPIIGQSLNNQLPDFTSHLHQQAEQQYPGLGISEVLSFDMFCYDLQGPLYTGVGNEFISSPRLDNLLSCHAGMHAMASSDRTKNSLLFCANHEENGSLSSTGAHGSFISSTLERIVEDSTSRLVTLHTSFLISADNAHATHPNFTDKMDKHHEIHLNKGPVIKVNANQRYTTSSISSAFYKEICRRAAITPQEFVMRSDIACGSTIGPMTAARLGTTAIDVGAPTLAMHSIREITGSLDPQLLYRTLHGFLDSELPKKLW